MVAMATQWNTRPFGNGQSPPTYDESLGDAVVLLLRGKNTFGDRIYSYLKISSADLRRMQEALAQGQTFNPSDFGTVVAAGQGEPPAEVKQEIESTYKVLTSGAQQAAEPAAPPPAAKGWDEF